MLKMKKSGPPLPGVTFRDDDNKWDPVGGREPHVATQYLKTDSGAGEWLKKEPCIPPQHPQNRRKQNQRKGN